MSVNQAHLRLILAAATVILLVFAFGRRHNAPSELPLPRRHTQSRLVLRRHVPLSLVTQPPQLGDVVPDATHPAPGAGMSSQQLIKIQPVGRETGRPAAAAPTSRRATPPAEADAVRYHRVVEGDTLPKIAKHYLGSPDRFVDIFEANREILTRPDLLPLGVRLVIPPRLVPVPRSVALPAGEAASPSQTPAARQTEHQPKPGGRVISDRDLLPVPP